MTGNRFSSRSFHFDKRRDDVAATTHLPSEVTGAEAAGDAQRTSQWWRGGGPLLWHVGKVGAGGQNGPPGHTYSPTSLRTRGNRGARCHLLPAKGGKKTISWRSDSFQIALSNKKNKQTHKTTLPVQFFSSSPSGTSRGIRHFSFPCPSEAVLKNGDKRQKENTGRKLGLEAGVWYLVAEEA